MAYGYYATITIDNTKVSGSSNLTNFPVLISGTYDGTGGEPDIRTTANGGKVENTASGGAGGTVTVPADLAFFSDSGLTTALDFEVQEYDASTGKLIAWVEIPTLLYASDTVIYMAYGDSAVSTSQENVAGTWNSNYLAVWHLAGSYNGTAGEVKDSTTNGFNGVATTAPSQVDGKVGKGQSFSRASVQHIDMGGAASALRLTGTPYSLQGWINVASTSTPQRIINMDDGNDFGGGYAILWNSNGTLTWTHATGSGSNWNAATTYPTGTFYLFHAVYDQSNQYLYKDGGSAVSTAQTSDLISENNDNLFLGKIPSYNQAYDGVLDEVRIATTGLSADWVATDYNTQSSPSTFYTMGSETALVTNTNPNTPSITAPTDESTGNSNNPTMMSSAFDDNDVGDTHQASQWLVSDDSGFTSTEWDSGVDTEHLTTVSINASHGTFGGALAGETSLAYGTTYYAKVRHQDNNDAWSEYSTAISFTVMNEPAQEDFERNTILSNEERVTLLKAATGTASDRLSDQLIALFGTTRQKEILGIIGDDGRPFDAQLDNYLKDL